MLTAASRDRFTLIRDEQAKSALTADRPLASIRSASRSAMISSPGSTRSVRRQVDPDRRALRQVRLAVTLLTPTLIQARAGVVPGSRLPGVHWKPRRSAIHRMHSSYALTGFTTGSSKAI